MRVLSIDSSSVTASVAIIEDYKIITDFYVNAGLTHSQTLMPMIDFAVKNSGLKISDIDLFSSTVGPGSFTGLRIGIATIKGLALGLGRKCMGISSLLAAAYNQKNFEGIISACMDARRGEVYNALFKVENGKLERITEDRAIMIEDLKSELKNSESKVKFVGDGSEICYSIISRDDKEKFSLASESSRYIDAKMVGFATFDLYKEENLLLPEDLNPKYLKLSQAQRMLLLKNNV